MILSRYDFYDIHSIIVAIRFKPQEKCNAELIQSAIDVLSASQIGNEIEDNVIRKKIRTIESLDRELFGFAFVDNVYTYGIHFIKDDFPYLFLKNAFKKLLKCVVENDQKQVYCLADALHNIPILFADNCKNFKRTAKLEFAEYNRIYKTDLLKELSKL